MGVEEGEKATQAQSVAISPRPLTPSLAAKRGAPAFIRTLFFSGSQQVEAITQSR